MEAVKHASHPKPVLTQTQNNTTIWIGHLKTDPVDHVAGQTFRCPADGTLDNIQLLSSFVQYPGELTLTLHEFDEEKKVWGSSISSCSLVLEKSSDTRWIRFKFSPLQLQKDVVYGFRLYAHDALVAIGEAASVNKQPFDYGHEWNADSKNEKGRYFSYFSLSFKVEMCA